MKITFDLDGTLYSSGSLATKAYLRIFEILDISPVPSEAVMLNTLGYPIVEIWEQLLPNHPELRQKATDMMYSIESDLIAGGEGILFPGVAETLAELKKRGHSLFILSNCDPPYLEAVAKRFEFDKYFTGLFCAGMFHNWDKTRILRHILQDDRRGVIVGDRFHDIQAGKDNNIHTIYCNYGFSDSEESAGADAVVHAFPEILPLIDGWDKGK